MSDRYTQIVEEIPPPPSTSDQDSARPSPTTHSSVTHPLCSNLVVTLDHPDPLRFIQTHSTSAGRGRPLTSRLGRMIKAAFRTLPVFAEDIRKVEMWVATGNEGGSLVSVLA